MQGNVGDDGTKASEGREEEQRASHNSFFLVGRGVDLQPRVGSRNRRREREETEGREARGGRY